VTTENQETTTNEAPANEAATARPPRPSGPRGAAPGGRRPGADGDEGTENATPTSSESSSTGGGGRPSGPPVRRPRRPGGKSDRFAPRRRVDQFGVDGIRDIDYKDFQRLRRYLSDRGKIEPRRKTGLSAYHQRSLTTAIKRARYMALLPYVANQAR
jgi:small subunit ribosomal protein S18